MSGTKSSFNFTTGLCIIKICFIIVVSVAGVFYFNPKNLQPFFKNGITGVIQGSSVVFFSFLGFEGITAVAEESVNPKRDVPWAVVGGITFCTTIYAVTSFILLSIAPTDGMKTETASA